MIAFKKAMEKKRLSLLDKNAEFRKNIHYGYKSFYLPIFTKYH